MLADSALGEAQVRRELADAMLAKNKVLHDRQARWVAEAVEQARRSFSRR